MPARPFRGIASARRSENPCARAVGRSRLDHERARHRCVEVTQQEIRRIRRSRRGPLSGGTAASVPVPPTPRSPPAPAARRLRRVTSVPLTSTVSPEGGLLPVRSRLDPNVNPLPGRQHGAVGRHDPNPRFRLSRHDPQTDAQHSRGTNGPHVSPYSWSGRAPGAAAKECQRDVDVTSQRRLTAGQVLSHFRSVFHEYRCFGL